MVEYFDGNSAAAHQVAIEFTPDGIIIRIGAIEQTWLGRDIRYASGSDSDAPPVTFRNQKAGLERARLVIDDEALLGAIRKRCPDLNGGEETRRERRGLLLAVGGGVVGFLAIIGIVTHLLPGVIAPLIPIAWEEKMGRAVYDDIGGFAAQVWKGSGKACTRPAGLAALEKMTARLTAVAQSPYRFRVKVIDIDEINAFAAPGGYIIFFKKLIDDASGPDEVAGIFAHEMGHVIARHSTKSMARDMGVSLLFEFALGGYGGGIAGTAGQALLSTAYSRDAEREADEIGLDILARAKISSQGVWAFFDKLAEQQGASERKFAIISTHPLSANRAEAARRRNPPGVSPALSAADWAALKKICG